MKKENKDELEWFEPGPRKSSTFRQRLLQILGPEPSKIIPEKVSGKQARALATNRRLRLACEGDPRRKFKNKSECGMGKSRLPNRSSNSAKKPPVCERPCAAEIQLKTSSSPSLSLNGWRSDASISALVPHPLSGKSISAPSSPSRRRLFRGSDDEIFADLDEGICSTKSLSSMGSGPIVPVGSRLLSLKQPLPQRPTRNHMIPKIKAPNKTTAEQQDAKTMRKDRVSVGGRDVKEKTVAVEEKKHNWRRYTAPAGKVLRIQQQNGKPSRPPSPGQEVVEELHGRKVTAADRNFWLSAFTAFQHDGELHQSCLPQAMQLCGYDDVETEHLPDMRYTTLSADEFVNFLCLYECRWKQKYLDKFEDLHGGLPVSEEVLESFFLSCDSKAHVATLIEIRKEIAQDTVAGCIGLFSFADAMKILEIYRSREAFRNVELDHFRMAFQVFDRDLSGEIELVELFSALSWLGLGVEMEDISALFFKVGGPHVQGLSERQFIRLLRKVHETELEKVVHITAMMQSEGNGDGEVTGAKLCAILKALGCKAPACAVLEVLHDLDIGGEAAQNVLRSPNFNQNSKLINGLRFKLGSADICDILMRLRSGEGFSRQEWQDMQLCFDRLAVGGSSSDQRVLDVLGVSRALRWEGFNLSMNKVRAMMSDIDIAGGHCTKLGFRTFVKLVRKCVDNERARCVEIFKKMDAECLGSLNSTQQFEAFQFLGCLDENGDPPYTKYSERNVDVPGFCDIMLRYRKKESEIMRKFSGFNSKELAELKALFVKFDDDDSGDISCKELAHLIAHFFPEYAHSADWRPSLLKLLAQADQDVSGTLDFHEFLALMRLVKEEEDETRLEVEIRTIEENHMSPQAVRDLRVHFQTAQQDAGWEDDPFVPLRSVEKLITACIPHGERASHVVEQILNQGIRVSLYTGSRLLKGVQEAEDGTQKVDFPVFLCIMRKVDESGVVNQLHST